MLLTPLRALSAFALSALISLFLFYGTSGILGPYGQPNDLYHLTILWLLSFLVLLILIVHLPGRSKK